MPLEAFDPYRPPHDPDDPSQSPLMPGGGPPVPWDSTRVLEQGWEIVKPYWPVLVFAPFVAGLCESVPTTILNQLTPGGAAGVGVWFAGVVLQTVLGAFFGAGLAKLHLVAARRREPSFGAIFEGGPWFGKVLGADVLVAVVSWALTALTLAPAGGLFAREVGIDLFADPRLIADREQWVRHFKNLGPEVFIALGAGVVVFVILSVLITLRLRFARYYIVDTGCGPIEALQASFRATKGNVLRLMGFFILAGLLNLVGLVACCVGAFATAAVVAVAEALIYLHLSGRLEEGPPPS